VGVAYKHAVIDTESGVLWFGLDRVPTFVSVAGGVGNYRHAMVTGHLGSVLVLSAT